MKTSSTIQKSRFSNFRFSLFSLAILSLSLITNGFAVSLLEQDFATFNTGNLVGQGNWTQSSSGTPNLTIANGTVLLSTSGQDAGTGFTSTNSGSLYMGLKLKVTSANATGDYFASFNNAASGTNYSGRVFAKKGTGTNKFVLGLMMGSTNATATYGTTELDLNTEYVLILKYNFVSGTLNDTAAIYVNPSNTSTESSNTSYTTSTWAGSTAEQAALAAVSFRQGAVANAASATISKLFVTTDWASLAALSTGVSIPVPTISSISPEAGLPGSSVTITGTNLASPTSVTFTTLSGTANATVTSGNATQIVCTVPAGTTTGTVTVTTANGSATGSFRSLSPIAVPYGLENFETSQGRWFTYNSGGNKNWAYVSSTLGGGNATNTANKAMEMNGFGSDVVANDWLVLGPLDCSAATNPVVAFNALARYTSNGTLVSELAVKVSTDYTGLGDPSSSTWTNLTFSKPASDMVKTPSGQVVLTGASGQSAVYVAFHYTAAGTASGSTALWQIDDVELYNMTTPALSVSAPGSSAEGATASIGRVSIPSALASDLTITLRSGDATEILVDGTGGTPSANSTVTIYAGDTYAEFLIYPQADGTVDGTQSVQITADAPGYDFGQAMVNVTDIDYSLPSVVINKTFNNGSADVIELLVVGNGTVGSTLDMQGMVIKDYSGSGASDGGGSYTFATSATWQSLKAGTLVVLTHGNSTTEDLDASDFLIKANLGTTALFTGNGSIDVGNTEVVQIKAAGSPTAGHTGAIHTFAFGSTTAAQVVAAPMPKLVGSASGSNQVATNSSSALADFNGTGITSLTSPVTFGVAHNATNAAFISSLRGVQSLSVSIDSASQIIPEDSVEQVEALTVSLSSPATQDVTVTLNASISSALNLPASVVVPAGSSSTKVSFTPINDSTIAGNREVTISASSTGFETGTNSITVVDVQFNNPSVVINEINNNGSSADSIELLVIQNSLNMAGMILKDLSANMSGDSGGKYTFANVPLWQSVPAGTLIVITADTTATEDTDASDGVLTVMLSNTTYFTASGTFDFSNTDMVTIKSSGSPTSGLTGAIHSFAVGTAGSYFKLATGAKLIAASGTAVSADNSNSTLADFNGTGVSATTSTLGSANNAANQVYINNLRSSVPPVISGSLSINGTVGIPISSYQIVASGNPQSYSSQTLPSGLTLNTSSGLITGTPTESTAGSIVTISATNTSGTGTANLTITIAKGTPVITTPPTASSIDATQSLASATLSGGVASVAGNFTFADPTIVPGVSGNFSVTFTPSSVANYEVVTLTVPVTVVPVSSDYTFADWSGNQTLTTGLLKKFAIGGALNASANSEEPVTSLENSTLSITAIIRTNNSKLTIGAESTTDLSTTWTSANVTSTTAGLSQSGLPSGCERRKFSVPSTGSKQFLRLQATLAP